MCIRDSNNTWRYVDVLQQLVDSYNATQHRSIGMAPNEVDASNEGLVEKKLRWRYDVGDTVQIATTRHMPFAKGYAMGT